jgi:hypothetical protein
MWGTYPGFSGWSLKCNHKCLCKREEGRLHRREGSMTADVQTEICEYEPRKVSIHQNLEETRN